MGGILGGLRPSPNLTLQNNLALRLTIQALRQTPKVLGSLSRYAPVLDLYAII